MAEVEKFASESAIKLFVGNKCDADEKRKVTFEEGKDAAGRYNVKFLETSAKTTKGVQDAFQLLAKEIKSKVLPKKASAVVKESKFFIIFARNPFWRKEVDNSKRKENE